MRRIRLMWLTFIVSLAVMAVIPCMIGSIVDLQVTKAQFDLKGLRYALDIYKQRRDHLPSEQEGLEALVGVAVVRVQPDPWGYRYVYRTTEGGAGYALYSVGVDGRDDRGGGDDVTTTPKKYRCEDYGVNCPPSAGMLFAYGVALTAVVSLTLAVAFTLAALYRWLRRLVLERV